MGYTIEYDPELLDDSGILSANIPQNVLKGMKKKLENLAKAGNKDTHKHLTGRWEGYCKLTHGSYRVIYSVDEEAKKMRVHDVGPRESIYDS